MAGGRDGEMPLHLAVVSGKADIVQLILENTNNEVDPRGSDGSTPLHKAASVGQPKCVESLIAAGADVNTSVRGLTPLHFAARTGSKVFGAAVSLLASGADPMRLDDRGNTVRHVAARAGNVKLISKLVESGAVVDPKMRNGYGCNIFDLARHAYCLREVREILIDMKRLRGT